MQFQQRNRQYAVGHASGIDIRVNASDIVSGFRQACLQVVISAVGVREGGDRPGLDDHTPVEAHLMDKVSKCDLR